jgi:hypothetical protein
MSHAKHWTIDLFIDENSDERNTRAEARLQAGDHTEMGSGMARRNPVDQENPAIGDELAAARALFDLAHHLLETAAYDIERGTHTRAHVHA